MSKSEILEIDLLKSDGKITKHDVKDKYFIKDIENITGIKAHTIRIWEQRYKILVPKRTDTAVRYYDEEDLKFILNVSILNKNGYKISKLAKLTREEIAKKCLTVSETSPKFESQINALTSSMLEFDEREFNKILAINTLKMGMDETMINIIFPFMSHIGILWNAGSIHPAHELFVTNLIRQRLFVGIDNLSNMPYIKNAKFLLFVPAGEKDDINLLFTNYILRSYGFEVFYIGTGLPIEDLNNIFAIQGITHIYTSLSGLSSQLPVQIMLTSIAKSWPKAQIYITGPQVNKRSDLNIPSNMTVVDSASKFKELALSLP